MNAALDFLIAIGALLWWVCVASLIAFSVSVAYRRVLDRFWPLDPHPGYVPDQVTRQFREPMAGVSWPSRAHVELQREIGRKGWQ